MTCVAQPARAVIRLILVALATLTLGGCPRGELAARLSEMSPPEEPAEFHSELDYDRLVEIVRVVATAEELAPEDRAEFEADLHELHREIIGYVAAQIQVPRERLDEALWRLERELPAVAEVYLIELRDESAEERSFQPTTETYRYKTVTAVDEFNELLSAWICETTLFAFSLRAEAAEAVPGAGLLWVPCRIVLSEVLVPVVEKMAERALIADYVLNETRISEHVRGMVAELATAEDRFRARVSRRFQRELLWGFVTSEAHLATSVEGTVKGGFDLQEFFLLRIIPEERRFLVTLPAPKILSLDVRQSVNTMDPGFFVPLDEWKLNGVLREGRARIERQALDTGILDEARVNAERVIKEILAPFAEAPGLGYEIDVEFRPAASFDDRAALRG